MIRMRSMMRMVKLITLLVMMSSRMTEATLQLPSLAINIGVGSKNQTLTAELSFEPTFIKTTTTLTPRNTKLFAPNLDSFTIENSSSYRNTNDLFITTLRTFPVESKFGYDDLHLLGTTLKQARFIEPQSVSVPSLSHPVLKQSASITIHPKLIEETSEPISKLLQSTKVDKITISARSNQPLATLIPGDQPSTNKLNPTPFQTEVGLLALQASELILSDQANFPVEDFLVDIDQPSILLPPAIYDQFYKTYISQTTPLDGFPIIPCESIPTLPTLEFVLYDDQSFRISPQAYVAKLEQCLVLLARSADDIPFIVLGVPFFYDRSITIDYSQKNLIIGHLELPPIVASLPNPPHQSPPPPSTPGSALPTSLPHLTTLLTLSFLLLLF